MSRPGAMYLFARQGAADHRLAAGLALAEGHTAAAHRYATAAEGYDAQAAAARAHGRRLYAARKLGLGGSAGRLPSGYFADAPRSSEERVAGSE